MTRQLPRTMRAVGFHKYLPISDVNCLLDVELPVPEIKENEVLIKVKAVSVNPIDTKRRKAQHPKTETTPKVLGWDGSGIIADVGKKTNSFREGDEVFFTGCIFEHGCNSEYYRVHESLVGNKPKSLTFEQAAAMPLTCVTAADSLFDRLQLSEKDKGKSILLINSAGGVGSIASQLAKNLGMCVIGTASRHESEEWSFKYGCDHVLNHSMDLIVQFKDAGLHGVDYVLINYDPLPYWDAILQIINPQGKICFLADCSQPIDISKLKEKSLTLVAENMSTRAVFNTPDVNKAQEHLNMISKMLDEGKMKCTLTKTLSPINAANVREAHRIIEERKMIGKLVVTGF